jgi:hypothetical protein
MKRRQLLMLFGCTTVTTIVISSTSPAQAFLPLWLRFLLIGSRVRKAAKNRRSRGGNRRSNPLRNTSRRRVRRSSSSQGRRIRSTRRS